MTALSVNSSFQNIGNPSNTNFPKDEEGRTYHLGLKTGELANRIIMVGEPGRAELLADSFDSKDYFKRVSNRGFITYTGTFEGKSVSVMSIGMGTPMMDFAVRESKAITNGPIVIIRLGSCGTPNGSIKVGTVVGANKSVSIQTNYDAYEEDNKPHFMFSKPITPDLKLHMEMLKDLKNESKGGFLVDEGVDFTADSFYSSQGRIDQAFDDKNSSLIEEGMVKYPDCKTLQMETFHLFFLSKIAEKEIHAASCAIVLANRVTNDFYPNEDKKKIEVVAGRALLKTVTNYST